jgi:hypothetical protein
MIDWEVGLKNGSLRLYVTIQGILGGLAGMIHGVAEVLQGNRPTEGQWLVSVGAFTLIPNYLATGIAAILVGLCILAWTVGFIHTPHGATVFLCLAALSFLVGGGVAQVVFFVIAWGVATQIRRPLTWWRKILPDPLRRRIAGGWWWNFAAGYFFLGMGIFIWLVLTPPGAEYNDLVAQYICWVSLLIGLVFQVLTIVSGFARDAQQQEGLGG